MSNGIEPLLRSLGVDFSQATDVYAVAALRNLLFAGLVGGGIDEMDLIAIDIQREHDVGLGSLNQTRKAMGMSSYGSFADLTPDPVLQRNLKSVYHNINNVDLFIGGLAEPHAKGAMVGPTFQAIIADQFQALRAGDRFFWQNEGFNQGTAWWISRTTLTQIMQRNTATPSLQANLFVQSPIPPHVKPHVPPPSTVNAQGRQRPAVMNDGI